MCRGVHRGQRKVLEFGIWTQVHWRNRTCSKLLGHPSSPSNSFLFFALFVCLFWDGVSVYTMILAKKPQTFCLIFQILWLWIWMCLADRSNFFFQCWGCNPNFMCGRHAINWDTSPGLCVNLSGIILALWSRSVVSTDDLLYTQDNRGQHVRKLLVSKPYSWQSAQCEPFTSSPIYRSTGCISEVLTNGLIQDGSRNLSHSFTVAPWANGTGLLLGKPLVSSLKPGTEIWKWSSSCYFQIQGKSRIDKQRIPVLSQAALTGRM